MKIIEKITGKKYKIKSSRSYHSGNLYDTGNGYIWSNDIISLYSFKSYKDLMNFLNIDGFNYEPSSIILEKIKKDKTYANYWIK